MLRPLAPGTRMLGIGWDDCGSCEAKERKNVVVVPRWRPESETGNRTAITSKWRVVQRRRDHPINRTQIKTRKTTHEWRIFNVSWKLFVSVEFGGVGGLFCTVLVVAYGQRRRRRATSQRAECGLYISGAVEMYVCVARRFACVLLLNCRCRCKERVCTVQLHWS